MTRLLPILFLFALAGCGLLNPAHHATPLGRSTNAVLNIARMMPPSVSAPMITQTTTNGCLNISHDGTNRVWCYPPQRAVKLANRQAYGSNAVINYYRAASVLGPWTNRVASLNPTNIFVEYPTSQQAFYRARAMDTKTGIEGPFN